jgi:hypothetical protein
VVHHQKPVGGGPEGPGGDFAFDPA